MGSFKICIVCGKKFAKDRRLSQSQWQIQEHCSRFCGHRYKRPSVQGVKNTLWKGDQASYSAKHHWIVRWRGRPKTCEHCGRTGLTGYSIHWANISRKYKRILSDYIRLCVPCHKLYDLNRN